MDKENLQNLSMEALLVKDIVALLYDMEYTRDEVESRMAVTIEREYGGDAEEHFRCHAYDGQACRDIYDIINELYDNLDAHHGLYDYTEAPFTWHYKEDDQ